MKKAKRNKQPKVMPRLHRAMLKKLTKQPFVMATSKTLPYLSHLPPATVIRAHKIIAGNMGPSFYVENFGENVVPIRYLPGSVHHESKANHNELDACGRGLHVGTVEWCQYCYTTDVDSSGNFAKLLLAEVEFKRSDVAAFPRGSAEVGRGWAPQRKGKFRLYRLKVLSVRVFSAAEVKDATLPDHKKVNDHQRRPMLDAAIFEPKVPKAKRA